MTDLELNYRKMNLKRCSLNCCRETSSSLAQQAQGLSEGPCRAPGSQRGRAEP